MRMYEERHPQKEKVILRLDTRQAERDLQGLFKFLQ